jgi:hypothetical protein
VRLDTANKKSRAIELLTQGLDIGAIAERTGLSRNRVTMIADECQIPVIIETPLCLITRRAKKNIKTIITTIRQNKNGHTK